MPQNPSCALILICFGLLAKTLLHEVCAWSFHLVIARTLFQSCLSIYPLIPHFIPINFTLHIMFDGPLTFGSVNQVHFIPLVHWFHSFQVHEIQPIFISNTSNTILFQIQNYSIQVLFISIQCIHVIQFKFHQNIISINQMLIQVFISSYKLQVSIHVHKITNLTTFYNSWLLVNQLTF